ncbi:hypothetical protein Bca101_092228 [Brassica carinata]
MLLLGVCSVPLLEFITRLVFYITGSRSTAEDTIPRSVKSSCGVDHQDMYFVFFGHGLTASTPLHNSITN